MEGKEFIARSFSQQITSNKNFSIGKERAILRWLNHRGPTLTVLQGK